MQVDEQIDPHIVVRGAAEEFDPVVGPIKSEFTMWHVSFADSPISEPPPWVLDPERAPACVRIWSLVIGVPGILLPSSASAGMRCRWTGDYMSDQHLIE